MIELVIPSIPVSVNAAYMTIRKGNKTLRILTKEGRNYKAETAAHLVSNYPVELAKFKKDRPYVFCAIFSVPGVFTKGWPDKAKNRYKRLDVSNRIKMLEDVLADVTNVDDSGNFVTIAQKIDDAFEQTRVLIWDLTEEVCPFTNVLYDL